MYILGNLGITLAKAGDSNTFSGIQGDGQKSFKKDSLLITQALLGHTAKENEYNVVEVGFEFYFSITFPMHG